MQKVVEHGLKLDLHIHSYFSSAKDGKKVAKNTLENLPILVEKLNENAVNICAITDHDAFSNELYVALKQEEQADGTIQKVLPGVEFSVRFIGRSGEETVHVIAIFDDSDGSKVQHIETILKTKRPDICGSYSEESFLAILREISVDTILIAHQKNTLSSATTRKNDANSLGNDKFLELVYSDYFEAYEFKNRRNEIINKNYLVTSGLEEEIRFVTGTDCHDWTVYPREDKSDTVAEFPYTYAKCLPTFKGLVMAVTDHLRLKRVDSFFNVDKFTLDAIRLSFGSQEETIPLSKGINVIIGDNSIGKSMILHAITGFEKKGEKKLPNGVKNGYKAYIKKNNLKISKQIDQTQLFAFDMQGEVRSKFEENTLNSSEFLSKYFPKDINSTIYRQLVDAEIDRMFDYLEKKFKLDAEIKKLSIFTIPCIENSSESLIFEKNLRRSKGKTDDFCEIKDAIDVILNNYQKLLSYKIEADERNTLNAHIDALQMIYKKYESVIQRIEHNNSRIEKVANVIDKISARHNRSITDAQKQISTFSDNTMALTQRIVEIQRQRNNLGAYSPSIEERRIEPNSNQIHEYEFISKLSIDTINTNYIIDRIQSVIKSGKSINWETITERELSEILLRYDGREPVLQFFKTSLQQVIDPDFKPKHSIICQGMDKSEELSTGLDAKIYFDILSYETTQDGIYIIDQPEDNVSQPAIKSYLLSCFKNMGENRQVIIVTHNPQFIVNLDIDNLVFIHRENGKLQIQSGALEYVCPEYSVLEIVADNIDGGLESIQKRWKRYEKVNRI